jgi:hypothetical protein
MKVNYPVQYEINPNINSKQSLRVQKFVCVRFNKSLSFILFIKSRNL